MSTPALEIEGLRIELTGGAPVVQDLTISVGRGEILGVVGESGSGKTTMALSLLGFARPGVRIAGGSVKVAGEELVGRSERQLRRLRGRLVSYVPQDPGTSLNPALRISDQISDKLRAHFPERATKQEVTRLLERVHLPTDRAFRRRYPHQLSGGQLQRVAIAMAIAGEPPLVVLDEPTTALDVVTQARILTEVDRLRRELGVAMVYVSHNLAVIASVADRVGVMYGGYLVEDGPVEDVLRAPAHPYTLGLLSSIPDHTVSRRLQGIPGIAVGVGDRPPGCPFAPRCHQKPSRADEEMPPIERIAPGRHVRCFEWQRTPAPAVRAPMDLGVSASRAGALLAVEHLRAEYRSRAGTTVAADDVSFSVGVGESVALVGESGSGKTTIARCVAGLHVPTSGRILLDGEPLGGKARRRSREQRRRVQIVFQNPYDSLNPRHRIDDAIAWPARLLRGLSRREARAEVAALLERVRLSSRLASRYPSELSGGERQRVAIARALAAQPDLLICDEVTSALDVSVQAAVLELLAELRADLGLALLFISHDLGVVASVSDRLLVLEHGVVRESGTTRDVLAEPSDSYTQVLVEAAPRVAAISETAGHAVAP